MAMAGVNKGDNSAVV